MLSYLLIILYDVQVAGTHLSPAHLEFVDSYWEIYVPTFTLSSGGPTRVPTVICPTQFVPKSLYTYVLSFVRSLYQIFVDYVYSIIFNYRTSHENGVFDFKRSFAYADRLAIITYDDQIKRRTKLHCC